MRYKSIDSSLFKRNRQKLINVLKKNSLAIIHSSDEMNRSGDQNYRFRQNSNLFYLTGIEQEKTVLLILPSHRQEMMKEILFIRKSSKNLEIWEGHKLTFQEASDISGIKTIKWLDEFNSLLQEQMMQNDTVYFDVPEFQKYKSETGFRGQRFLKNLRDEYPLHNYERLFPLISQLRMVKEPEEIEIINEACKITAAAFNRILKIVKPGIPEYQVEAELTHEFISLGSAGHAYHPIIASGESACILHYILNNKPCKDGDLLLLDFGAEYANYSSDLSRTIPVNGIFSKRQRELYEAVLRIFKFALGLMKPGTTINKIHKEVCRKSEEEHIRLGLYTADELKNNKIDESLCLRYYMHSTSHFMGLDVHDAGNKDDVLKPGMILTCEPAIYIPEEKTGIRIETDVLITENGIIDLMEDVPIEPGEIEKLMKK